MSDQFINSDCLRSVRDEYINLDKWIPNSSLVGIQKNSIHKQLTRHVYKCFTIH